MEASALQAPAGLARARISVSAPLLRLRSDDQLVALFRAGHDDAFRAIHDRYRQRLFAYTRQMLPGSSHDAEDALQDVFVRAYSGLRANRRALALRPWLYRVAHNRCIDELRRPIVAPTAIAHELCAPAPDPIAQVEQRESLRRLISDLLRLPTQQRSALLMRELGGMSYAEVAEAMDVTVPAVKSLLVRARVGLTLAAEARDTACVTIRDEIALAHDRGVRCSGTVRRHVTDCGRCRDFQSQLRRSRHQFAALTPTLGPIGVLANLLGWGGGAAGGGAAASGGGATATTGVLVGGGTAGAVGTLGAGASHVAALIAATVVTAGGAVAIQHSIASSAPKRSATPPPAATVSTPPAGGTATPTTNAYAASSTAPTTASSSPATTKASSQTASGQTPTRTPSISGGDNIVPTATPTGGADPSATGAAGQTTSGTVATSGTTGTAATTGTTGASDTGGTTGTGTTGTTTSTGAGSTTGTSTSSTGTAGSTPSATTGSSSSTTGTSGTTTSGVGSTPPTSTGTTTGPPTGP